MRVLALVFLVACTNLQLTSSQSPPPPPPPPLPPLLTGIPTPPPAAPGVTEGFTPPPAPITFTQGPSAPPTPANSTECQMELPGTDVWGHDLEQVPRAGLTLETCIDTCINTTGCHALTVTIDGQCYFKNSEYNQGPMMSDETVTTYSVALCAKPENASVGLLEPVNPATPAPQYALPESALGCVVEFPNLDFWGHNLESDARYNITIEQCRDVCVNTSGCEAFTMKNDARCYLKNGEYRLGPSLPLSSTLGSWVVQFCPRPAQLLDPVNPRDPALPMAPVPGNTPAECTIRLPGIEFAGPNLETVPRYNKSQNECAAACIATEGCAAVTYKTDGACFLKSTAFADAPVCVSAGTSVTLLAQNCRKPAVTLPPQNPADPAAPFNSSSLTCLSLSNVTQETSSSSTVPLGCTMLVAVLFAVLAVRSL